MKHGSLFKVGSNRYSIVVHLELNNAICSILHVILVGSQIEHGLGGLEKIGIYSVVPT